MGSKPSHRIAEMAERLGLSIYSVSVALRGLPGVSEATRKRIQEEAQRCGYRPDPATSALAESRWQGQNRRSLLNLTFIGGALSNDALAATPQFQLYAGVALTHGYGLSPLAVHPTIGTKSINRMLKAVQTRGVLLDRVENAETAKVISWDDLEWSAYSWVAVNESRYSPPVHRVLNNAFNNLQETLTIMQRYGYKRIAFLQEADNLSRENTRQHAAFLQFQVTQKATNLGHFQIQPMQLVKGRVVNAILRFKPDALLLGYTGLHHLLPRELSALPWTSLAIWDPDGLIAGNHISLENNAQASVTMLSYQIRRRDFGIPKTRHTLLVDGKWVDGASFPDLKPEVKKQQGKIAGR